MKNDNLLAAVFGIFSSFFLKRQMKNVFAVCLSCPLETPWLLTETSFRDLACSKPHMFQEDNYKGRGIMRIEAF